MRPDRVMWAVGLTLAGTVLAGLVLNVAGGLTRLSWAIALTVAVLACAGVLLAIRKRGARREPGNGGRRESRDGGLPVSPLTGGFLLLAALLAGGAVWLAAASANGQRSPGFAQLWLVPTKGASMTLGVRDNYPGRQALRLTLRGGGNTVATWDLRLAEGETWQRTVSVPAPRPLLPAGKLTATLTTPDRVLSVTS
jgi:hypothetical protein